MISKVAWGGENCQGRQTHCFLQVTYLIGRHIMCSSSPYYADEKARCYFQEQCARMKLGGFLVVVFQPILYCETWVLRAFVKGMFTIKLFCFSCLPSS